MFPFNKVIDIKLRRHQKILDNTKVNNYKKKYMYEQI